ncbi:hypothetical protein EPN52_06535 [bacterium]|nr:MAG: hypothetical protein EPN52_06535 [bacterium]
MAFRPGDLGLRRRGSGRGESLGSWLGLGAIRHAGDLTHLVVGLSSGHRAWNGLCAGDATRQGPRLRRPSRGDAHRSRRPHRADLHVPSQRDHRLRLEHVASPRPRGQVTRRVVVLDDAVEVPASDTVGAKAARLAQARRLGLPALQGVVIPACEAEGALALGAAAAVTRGSGGARLAIMGAELDPALMMELHAATQPLGASLVVRSSSALELDAAWAGAYTSYVGVAPADLGTAIRGCWASAFSRDVIERCEELGITPAGQRLAVLIQPAASFAVAGVAALAGAGTTIVTVTRGSPANLLGGWVPGYRVVVTADGAVQAPAELADVDASIFREVASIAHAVHAAFEDDLIEWGWAPERGVLLLQARPAAPLPKLERRNETPASAPAFAVPVAVRIARLATQYGGPLGDALVLPWAVGAADFPAPAAVTPVATADPADAFAEAQAIAARLTAATWDHSGHRGVERARKATEALAVLRDGLREAALRTLGAGNLPNITQGVRLVALLRGLGQGLVEAGLFAQIDDVWRTSVNDLERALARPHLTRSRTAAAREGWEPFVYLTVAANGNVYSGTPAAPGIGAGSAWFAARPDSPRPARRGVLVVPYPLPGYAPLLWNAAALISVGGGPSAHFIEVARSLSVPAVVGCDAGAAFDFTGPLLAAVDGTAGRVTLLHAEHALPAG